LYLKESHI
jgi:hypothetical protein